MAAVYSWDSQESKWEGSTKVEEQYDSIGYMTLEAEYYWDSEKEDWRGNYMSEYASSDTLYLNASYYWDENEWCWTGNRKSEYNYKTNTDYYYNWDSKQKNWVGNYGSRYEEKPSQTSTDFIYTYYKWENSKWVGDYRSTRTDVWNRDDNLATRTYKYELLSSTPSKNLKQNYSVKYVYNYSVLTTVETVTASATISVADCIIVVNATDDILISISSAAGIRIASGTGSVTASVVPGIYLITIGNKTTKVLVR
ncbi:MAG: hypothetical protein MJY68_04615 [Bacteroidaceae bacterium]|nr:hypothetical protein [Bacteroidaceae bacterium]